MMYAQTGLCSNFYVSGWSLSRVLAACYLISALGCAFAWGRGALLVFRFIGGLGIGGSSVVGPML